MAFLLIGLMFGMVGVLLFWLVRTNRIENSTLSTWANIAQLLSIPAAIAGIGLYLAPSSADQVAQITPNTTSLPRDRQDAANVQSPVAPKTPSVPLGQPASVYNGVMSFGASFGGVGGSEFSDAPQILAGSTISQISIHYGERIDRIQVVLNTGALPRHGESAGNEQYVIRLVPHEYLTAISGTTSETVRSLKFETSFGNVYGPFGTEDGTPFTLKAPRGYQVVGFVGRSGWLVDSIGVLIAKIG